MTWAIHTGNCIEQMAKLPESSVDAVVCDPPYGIGFMGKEWDGKAIAEAAARDRETRKSLGPESASRPGRAQPRSSSAFGNEAIIAGPVRGGADFQAWCEAWAAEALRVLKPGGHLLAFGGPRTFHRLVAGVEDAGFEIRDSIMWLYGSGFPKSLDVSKAIDKAAGAEREVVGEEPDRWTQKGGVLNFATDRPQESVPITGAPVTEDAMRWDGWGTALKPAHESIVVARKPPVGTVAANVLEYGTGAINVAGCRIDAASDGPGTTPAAEIADDRTFEGGERQRVPYDGSSGRWPANVVLDSEAAAMLDEQTGELVSGPESDRGHRRNADREAARNAYGGFQGQEVTGVLYGDRGGASRFFYCAKTSRAEREAGLDGFALRTADPYGEHRGRRMEDKSRFDGEPAKVGRNHHPTVKPINLMRWLVRLVTPPGGVVLDPFTGSGSTGAATVLEGFDFIGIEREAEYVAIAEARIAFWVRHVGREIDDVLGLTRKQVRRQREQDEAGQPILPGFEVAA